MLVIADGGSTKADWRIVYSNKVVAAVDTTGFNPNYDKRERITAILQQELISQITLPEGGIVYYYGAGCWDPGRKRIVEEALAPVFPGFHIIASHDMLAAARATCGEAPGITCILGTGSNSVLFDGENEVDNVTNLGFLLGDEGSGSHIGKELVKAFFYREMPMDLQSIMENACPNGRKDILDKVYGGGVPAAYLASFAGLFSEQQTHPFIRQLVANCFREFLIRHVYKYENYNRLPVHFVGSIAWHFRPALEQVMHELSLKMGQVIKKPIDNLLTFHLAKV
jgi:N-acetylglucosamine kinase-like BadF-type ATPase